MPGSLSNIMASAKRRLSPSGERKDETSDPEYNNSDCYLSYYDSRITLHDKYTLSHHDWLEDNTINFWEEYLEREELVKYPKAKIHLVRPGVSQMIKIARTRDSFLLANFPHIVDTTHIFLPINNDETFSHRSGFDSYGSHWSLLVISLIDSVAFHYDSMGTFNDKAARDTVDRIQEILPEGRTLRFIQMRDVPRQTDGENCGVFVCVVMKHLLLKRLLRADANQKISMSMSGQDINYAEARKMMMGLVEARRAAAIENGFFDDKGVPTMN